MYAKRSDYKICPICGASLDLDEKCDCVNESAKRQQASEKDCKRQQAFISAPKGSGQVRRTAKGSRLLYQHQKAAGK